MNACTYFLGTNQLKPEGVFRVQFNTYPLKVYIATTLSTKTIHLRNDLHSSTYIIWHNGEAVTQLRGGSSREKHVNHLLELESNQKYSFFSRIIGRLLTSELFCIFPDIDEEHKREESHHSSIKSSFKYPDINRVNRYSGISKFTPDLLD